MQLVCRPEMIRGHNLCVTTDDCIHALADCATSVSTSRPFCGIQSTGSTSDGSGTFLEGLVGGGPLSFLRTECARCGNKRSLSRSHAPQRFLFRTLSDYGQSPKKWFPPRPMPRLCKECHDVYTAWEKKSLLQALTRLASEQQLIHAAFLEGESLPNV
jgi:hypothetical protein